MLAYLFRHHTFFAVSLGLIVFLHVGLMLAEAMAWLDPFFFGWMILAGSFLGLYIYSKAENIRRFDSRK